MSPAPVPASSRLAQLTRKPDRALGSRAQLDALLDSQLVATLATVLDGQPWVVPMLYGRDGDDILLHGSSGAGALRQVAAGSPAALCVVALDGLVVAESTFHSSANYRSAVIRGCLEEVGGQTKSDVLQRISDKIIPGRNAEVRPSTRKEESATMGLRLRITDENWIMKHRDGEPGEPEGPLDVWCGVVPLALAAGAPIAAPWSIGPVPPSVHAFIAARPAP
ncbi:pyridoxamine 5'-phosphate oxidase family protein [Nostocoides sp.]|jgi:nitroimidazol reductase NimA-like FMN-containing flavoprotein (pyridoxamine 5'-phosphate oxidase superfamily)|uniref:pyridoxamine 5'-phosphate oxidase family protein n=2 Tax=Nostocoides sp. TaxID=1917966 RepID=UPI002BE94DD6|nr:pyridoxamine 5'-phosphate oxidase family protein [Tetrasphaera sp.]